MNLTPIQAQVPADVSTNRPVGHEQARSAALSSLKKRGYVVLNAAGKHEVTQQGRAALPQPKDQHG